MFVNVVPSASSILTVIKGVFVLCHIRTTAFDIWRAYDRRGRDRGHGGATSLYPHARINLQLL